MLSNEARKFLLDMRLFLTAKSVKESDIFNHSTFYNVNI